MRDAVILVTLVVVCLSALRRPWVGVMAWSFVSLMSPHMQFGWAAAGWPIAMVIALCTLVGALITRDKQNPMIGVAPWWLLAFTVWICVTLPFSIFFDASYPLWERSMKIYLMTFVTLALITDRRKLDVFIWINVIAIAYYGVKGGIFTILTGGNYRVWGPGGFIGGNNELAVAVVTIVPLMRYLQLQMTNKHAMRAMTAAMALCVVTALGTYSRGALLALAAMAFFFWLKSPRKLAWGTAIILLGGMALPMMPDAWWDRMDTIQTYDRDDSALGRLNAWLMAWNLAKDRFFGGGFMIWTRSVFELYSPEPERHHAAHSIYFQIMGEHGFVGLFLFLAMGVSTWIAARRLKVLGEKWADVKWAAHLGPMLQVSMIGFGTGGAFLSLAYFDLPYNLMVVAVLGHRFASQRATVPAASEVIPPVMSGAARPAGAHRPDMRP